MTMGRIGPNLTQVDAALKECRRRRTQPSRAIAVAVSAMRVEKPHSLSYHDSTRTSWPSITWVCGRATVDDAAMWFRSEETSGSDVTCRTPFSGPEAAAAFIASLTSSLVTERLGTTFRSTTDTF